MNPAIARKRRMKAHSNGSHDAAHSQQSDRSINVGETERQISMVGGSILAVCGLLKGSLSGLALAAIGGALIYRGHTGQCQLYQALGHSTADQ